MTIYDELSKVFEIYNERLFNSQLPECIITLQRKFNTKGYFSAKRFISLNSSEYKHEIAINPDYFGMTSTPEIFSTIVHEMCHLSMEIKGKSCTDGYHDSKWAKEMLRVGLIPTDNGKEDGKKTGFKITHIIKPDGLFYEVTKEIMNMGLRINFGDRNFLKDKSFMETEVEKKKKETLSGKKFKYSCGCSNVWGKKDLVIKCVKCGNNFNKVSEV